VTIYSSVPRFIDFLQVGEENVPQLPPPWPLVLRDAFLDKTSYRFTIAVIADCITKQQRVEVNWPGVWNGLSAMPI
jgi:hypothetical protein